MSRSLKLYKVNIIKNIISFSEMLMVENNIKIDISAS